MSHERKGRLVHCFSDNGVNACRHFEARLPQSLLTLAYCTMRIRRSKRIVAGSLACNAG
jgi:hypothetical protein